MGTEQGTGFAIYLLLTSWPQFLLSQQLVPTGVGMSGWEQRLSNGEGHSGCSKTALRHLRTKSTPAAVCWSRAEQLGGVQRISGTGPVWPLVSRVCCGKAAGAAGGAGLMHPYLGETAQREACPVVIVEMTNTPLRVKLQ